MLKQFFELKKVISVALLIILVVYTGWLAKETHSPSDKTPINIYHPDFFAKNIKSTEFDKNGQIIHILKSPYLLHYPNLNSADLTAPNFIIYSNKNDKAPWYVSSRKGKTIKGTDIIYLIGNVVIHEPQGPKNNDLIIRTEALTIYSQKNYAETDKPVTIEEPGITVHSIGMKVYFKEKRVILLNQARGVYDEQKTTKHN